MQDGSFCLSKEPAPRLQKQANPHCDSADAERPAASTTPERPAGPFRSASAPCTARNMCEGAQIKPASVVARLASSHGRFCLRHHFFDRWHDLWSRRVRCSSSVMSLWVPRSTRTQGKHLCIVVPRIEHHRARRVRILHVACDQVEIVLDRGRGEHRVGHGRSMAARPPHLGGNLSAMSNFRITMPGRRQGAKGAVREGEGCRSHPVPLSVLPGPVVGAAAPPPSTSFRPMGAPAP